MKKFMKFCLALTLVGTIFIGGCAALIGSAANHVDKQLQAQHDAHAITTAQLASVHMGDSKASVIATLGSPSDSQHEETAGIQGGTDTSDCIYYDQAGASWSSTSSKQYQLCFDNGKLDAKNTW